MLPQSEWLDQAKALPEGSKAMISHHCGGGRKLLIEHKSTGYAAWCYRCSEAGWTPKGQKSLAERVAALRKTTVADRAAERTNLPPRPAIFDVAEWPAAAKVWLYKAGIHKDWISDLGFYYHAGTNRVVMPVLDPNGKLVFWQARALDAEQVKYLSPPLGPGQAKPLYKAVMSPNADHDLRPEILCLTEDIQSAVRVGQACSAWSLLGTSLTPASEAEIVKFGAKKVLVWLDPDSAGTAGRRKIVPQLRALGLDASAIRADRDPKLYPFDEIRRLTHVR